MKISSGINTAEEEPLLHKLVVVGDCNVGKSCMLERFMYDTFDPHFAPTNSIDYLARRFVVDIIDEEN